MSRAGVSCGPSGLPSFCDPYHPENQDRPLSANPAIKLVTASVIVLKRDGKATAAAVVEKVGKLVCSGRQFKVAVHEAEEVGSKRDEESDDDNILARGFEDTVLEAMGASLRDSEDGSNGDVFDRHFEDLVLEAEDAGSRDDKEGDDDDVSGCGGEP